MTLEKLIDKIELKHNSWDAETKEIVNELWSRMEAAETDVEVFELRVKKQWPTEGSNLYTQKEYDTATFQGKIDFIYKQLEELLDNNPTGKVIGE